MIQSYEQKLYAAIKKADAKAMPHKSAQDILKILTHDLALWWINQGNDTVLPLGYGETPELISARGEF